MRAMVLDIVDVREQDISTSTHIATEKEGIGDTGYIG